MGRTSEYIKRRVVAKFKQNKKISEVVRELKEEEDLSISRHCGKAFWEDSNKCFFS